jgi:hypothetical protein
LIIVCFVSIYYEVASVNLLHIIAPASAIYMRWSGIVWVGVWFKAVVLKVFTFTLVGLYAIDTKEAPELMWFIRAVPEA